MKKLLGLVFLVTLTGVVSWPSHSQTSVGLASLGMDIVSSIQLAKPEWKYESVSPITVRADVLFEPNPDVILQQWTFENQSVRIAVVSHSSVSEATAAIQTLASRGQTAAFEGLGEEDVIWGRGTVSFRKRNLTVNVNAIITEPTVDVAEAAKHEPDERKLSKEFARLVAKAIKDK
jgi:hypothetical protein